MAREREREGEGEIGYRYIGPRGCGGALDVGVSPGVCSLGSPVLVTSWDYVHALPRGVHYFVFL